MANPVFEHALATLQSVHASLETEVGRLSELDVRATGVQQRIDALKVQERELRKTNEELAQEVAAARQTIAQAETAKAEHARLKQSAAAWAKS
jgi:DNA-binding XRE family transcriptional regulator